MPFHTIPKDIKAKIPVLHHKQGFNVKEICGLLGVEKSLVYRTLQYHCIFGTSYNPHAGKAGWRCALSHGDLKFIVTLLTHRHCIYLDEIQKRLYDECGTLVSLATLLTVLHCLQYSCKVVSAHALERNDLLCSAFINTIADIVTDPYMLMFTDEAAWNKKTSARTKGWSLVGDRCVQRQCFSCGERLSILSVLTLDGIITYDIIPGSVTLAQFLRFLHELVVSTTVYLSIFQYLIWHIDSTFKSLSRSPKHPHFGQLQYPSLWRSACTC